MNVSYPAYMISGETIPLHFALGVKLNAPYFTVNLQQEGVEVRVPSQLNVTTNAVQAWGILSSASVLMNKNYSSGSQAVRNFELAATYPPSNSVFDPLTTSRRIAINGMATATIYSNDGNTTSSSSATLSMLDAQTIYLSQLATVRSSTSWVTYQLAAISMVSLVYARVGRIVVNPADAMYSARLDSHRLQKSMDELENLMKSGKIGEKKYQELKSTYEKEMARLKTSQTT